MGQHTLGPGQEWDLAPMGYLSIYMKRGKKEKATEPNLVKFYRGRGRNFGGFKTLQYIYNDHRRRSEGFGITNEQNKTCKHRSRLRTKLGKNESNDYREKPNYKNRWTRFRNSGMLHLLRLDCRQGWRVYEKEIKEES